MKRKIFIRIIAAAVLLTLLLTPFSAAWAIAPETWYWEGSGIDPGLVDCGSFFIDGEWSAWERGKNFFDNDGNLIKIDIHYHFVGMLTNRVTGLTIRDELFQFITIDVANNTFTNTGLIWNLNIPGHGVVILDVGTVVFDMDTWNILHEGGPHQDLHGLDVIDTLCTYMEG